MQNFEGKNRSENIIIGVGGETKEKRGPNNTIVSFDLIQTDRKSNAKYSHMLGIEFTFGIAQCFGFRSKFRFLIDFPL